MTAEEDGAPQLRLVFDANGGCGDLVHTPSPGCLETLRPPPVSAVNLTS
jgi:hypothetical protein